MGEMIISLLVEEISGGRGINDVQHKCCKYEGEDAKSLPLLNLKIYLLLVNMICACPSIVLE